jgi:glutathione reductase (NADPH)
VKTTQAYRGEHLLNGFDEDIRRHVGSHQKANGIDVRFNISPIKINVDGNSYVTHFDDGSIITADLVFMATWTPTLHLKVRTREGGCKN